MMKKEEAQSSNSNISSRPLMNNTVPPAAPDDVTGSPLAEPLKTPYNTPASVLYMKPKGPSELPSGAMSPQTSNRLANELQEKLNKALIGQRMEELHLSENVYGGVDAPMNELFLDDTTIDVTKMRELHDLFLHEQELYYNERKALEEKFEEKKAAIFRQRRNLIMGADDPKDQIPNFWCYVMVHNKIIREFVSIVDVDILGFLVDVRTKQLQETYGFTLEFEFRENPYFENTILTKSYAVPNFYSDNDPVLESVCGTKITWKQPVHASCFFLFFEAPWMEQLSKTSLDEIRETEAFEEMHELMIGDFNVGYEFYKLVPEALLWFTGENADSDDEDDEDYEQDDEDDEDDDDDDDDGYDYSNDDGENESAQDPDKDRE